MHASLAAMPFRSDPEDAAVGDVFGTFAVLVADTFTLSRLTPNSSATTSSIGYNEKPPARAKVDSYPVIEKYDIIFAFLGDLSEEERPGLYEIEEYEAEGWRANETITIDILNKVEFFHTRLLL